MAGHTEHPEAFPPRYLQTLRRQIHGSPYFTVNNLNRDFVGTRGFSIVFQRPQLARVVAEFPGFAPYLELVLDAECNAFYLNPLQLELGSRVDPHIDRSLRAYLDAIDPPLRVSVLYVDVPAAMQGGALVLQRGKRRLGKITPRSNLLVYFEGDLTHSVERLDSPGQRLSLVCEQYRLTDEELQHVPQYAIESRVRRY